MSSKLRVDLSEFKNNPMLSVRGMPRNLGMITPYLLENTLMSFVYDSGDSKVISIDKRKQYGYVDAILESPFDPYVACISSQPNEGKAKLLAGYLFAQAITSYSKGLPDTLRDYNMPLWVNLVGGYKNQVLDRIKDLRPSMLVIGNLPINSTDAKMEKARDLLCVCDNIPRILVSSGSDPLTLMYSKLYMEVNYSILIGSGLTKKQVI